MSLNDGLIIFSREHENAPLEYRTFGSILPRYPIIQAIVRPDEHNDMTIFHTLTGREEEIEVFVNKVLQGMKNPCYTPLYERWERSVYF